MNSNPPRVAYTVAICTHNHADQLRKTLEDLHQLEAPQRPFELLVIDNASSDATAAILDGNDWRLSNVETRVVREERLGVAHARNRAIEEARGEYLFFLDDDETADPNWLRAYESTIERWHPDALGGAIRVQFEDTPPPWMRPELLGFLGELDHGAEPRRLSDPHTPIYTGNCGFRMAMFRDLGRFDTDLGRRGRVNTGGEDVEMSRRILSAGLDIRWVPDAVIAHRIQSGKLRKGYFYELHYRQGRLQGRTKRGDGSRVPPLYLIPQLGRAIKAALAVRLRNGSGFTVRKEMNVVYFIGYILGWMSR